MADFSDYPRDNRSQRSRPGPVVDIEGINHNIAAIYDWVNGLPGVGEWLYVGKDTPFLASWVSYQSFDLTGGYGVPRFRRLGYDIVEIEGLARQNPYNAANPSIFRLPNGFIPPQHHAFVEPSAGGYSNVAIVGYVAGGSNAGLVQTQITANTDYQWLDGIRFSLIPSR